MTFKQLLSLRDEISALLLAQIEGCTESEHACVSQAANQLEQFGGMGGSTRIKAEAEIVRLLKRFDDTQYSSSGPWPVTGFMQALRARENAYLEALEACITAHKASRYEAMVAAVEAAANLIEDMKS